MNTTLIDRERELLARIELLRAALQTIRVRANHGYSYSIAYDVYNLADAALEDDK